MDRILMTSACYRAGAASVCITPEEPFWLAGYAARTAPAREKLSDLYASAFAVEDTGGERFVIVSADVIAVTRAIADPVSQAIQARHGLPRHQLLFAATHTHYAPEFRPEKQLFFCIPEEYAAKIPAFAEQLVARLTNVIEEALARLEPARLIVRRATAGFAHNRRRHGVKFGSPSPEDIVDHDLPILECLDAAGKCTAIVFGYACHNTTIPLEDVRYSGDWAGFAKERLQRDNPLATALFIAGAGADQDPEPRGSVLLSQQYGAELADAIEAELEQPGLEIRGPIRADWEEVTIPLQPVTREQLGQMLASDNPPQRVKAQFLTDQLARGETLITSYDVPLQVVRFGDELLVVALSGEPVIDWARKIKRLVRGEERAARSEDVEDHGSDSPLPNPSSPLVWVAGYCNDMFGYLPTRRVQDEGGYEGGRATLWSPIPAPFTDDVEERVSAAIERLVRQCS